MERREEEEEEAMKGGGAARDKEAKRRRCGFCFGGIAAAVLLLAVILVIVAFTAFRPKRPVTTVDSVDLQDLRVGVDIPNLGVRLNLSIGLGVSVTNPNKVGFHYSNTSALVLYQGVVVGEAPIPGGDIFADSTKPMNLTLIVLADRLLSRSSVYADVASGSLPLTTSTTISGKVRVLGVLRFHVVSRATCDLTVHVVNRTVDQTHCKYHTKL